VAQRPKPDCHARLFLGDPVLVDDGARAFLADGAGATSAAVDVTVIRPPLDSLLDVRAALQQAGLFATERGVWIRGLKNEPESEIDDLLAFLEGGVPDHCRLVATTGALDQRGRLYKWFKREDAVEDCRLEKDKQGHYLESALAAFVGARLRGNGIAAPERATVQAIVERAGGDIGVLAQEIDKLCLATDGAPDRSDVVKHMRDMGEVWVFALTDALSARNLGKAESMLDALLAQGQHPLAIIAVLATHVSQLADARHELDRLEPGAFPNNATKLDKSTHSRLSEPFRSRYRSEYRAYHLLRGASRYRGRQLSDLHGRLLAIDAALKSSRGEARALLSGFLVQACAVNG
jgi:DNA polymerase-3 subunit delta